MTATGSNGSRICRSSTPGTSPSWTAGDREIQRPGGIVVKDDPNPISFAPTAVARGCRPQTLSQLQTAH